MDETDLCFTPATELADAIRARKLSAVEITSTVLDRITALEPKLNGFAHLAADAAMDAAAKADNALAGGVAIGPLHGIPVTIKDLEPVRGMPFEGGTYLRRGEVASADNVVVSRLRNAGAIILGKTTTPEFGWKGVSQSPVTGITHNPWKLGFSAGASSSGAGSAFRSSFPFTVSGIRSNRTYAAGTMYSGRVSDRCPRNCSAPSATDRSSTSGTNRR